MTNDFNGNNGEQESPNDPLQEELLEAPIEAERTPAVTPQNAFLERIVTPDAVRPQLTGMYRDWFLDYASYVILERAVPHLDDGLKPVQRRILHSMKLLDDGRYNKVANIIGNTMQFHPHGDASIGDALVQIGQKELLVDTQGNWGNILTGDSAAAPRYIEARLAKFALEVVYNPKITPWMRSYDGRNQEPITLPVRFPLLLAQGAEGIAVGLASKILPHNFNEIIEAAISHLNGEPFTLLPDFPTGGSIDCSRYADGARGGTVKIRAKIEKLDRKTLVIREIPFSKTTSSLIESIRKAHDDGKIRVKSIEDNTAMNAEIVIHLPPDASPDRLIDALYAFTECEVAVWPNACVIQDDKPYFTNVSDLLRRSVDRTLDLLRQDLEIQLGELESAWHFASLEKIFIENRIYLAIEDCETWEAVLEAIEAGLKPWLDLLVRPLTQDDIVRLTELRIKRISKYDASRATEELLALEKRIEETKHHLLHIVDFTIAHFQSLRSKYGKGRERRTLVTSFETIEATRVVASNKKLYWDPKGGFIGSAPKIGEPLCDCSDIDDIIVIRKTGEYMIVPVHEKRFVWPDIIHAAVYNRQDLRTIYNVIYVDGASGITFGKRCAISSLIRERPYNLTQGTEKSSILYLSVNPNGEAERVEVRLSPRYKMRKPTFEFDFSSLPIRGQNTRGNIVSKHLIVRVSLKAAGTSTLGGLPIWFDADILRLNTEGRGTRIDEFNPEELLLAIYPSGTFETIEPETSYRFPEQPLLLRKFNPSDPLTIAYYNAEAEAPYLKRCLLEVAQTPTSLIGDNPGSRLMEVLPAGDARVSITFGGRHLMRPVETLHASEFIGVKSFRAKGKRLSPHEVAAVSLSPIELPTSEAEGVVAEGATQEGEE